MPYAAQSFRQFVFVLALGLCVTVFADTLEVERETREAGPEDGILCCNGRIPFLFNGNEVLTTTGRAGIFRSENRGALWHRSMDGLVAPNGVAPQVISVCQSSSEPRIVYALAGLELDDTPFNGLFSSADFGSTWTRRASVRTGSGFSICTVDPDDPRTLYVSSIFDDSPWKSSDGGQTVQRIDIPAFVGADVHPVHGVIYVVNFDAVYASTDGGASYQALSLPPGFIVSFKAAPAGHALFFWTLDPVTFEVTGSFRSTDGGTSFAAISGLPNPSSLAFDPTDASRIYASDGDGLLHVSVDGGLNFSLLPASNDPRFFGPGIAQIDVDSRGSVYLDTRAGPFRTDDGGQSFRPLLNGWRASAVNDLAFDADGELLVGVLNTRVILRQLHDGTFDAIGDSAVLNANGLRSATAVAASPTDPNIILVAGVGGAARWRTGDGGLTWTVPSVAGNPTNYNQARMVFASASRVYLALPTTFALPGLYRSDDAGQSFELLSTLPFGAIAVDPWDADTVYVGTFNSTDGLFKSTDGGQTLHNIGQPGAYSALAVDNRNPRIIYAGAKFGQVIRSLDGGQTFAPASMGLAGAGVHGFAQDPNGTLFVWIRGGGVFSTRDGAFTWQPIDTGETLRRSGVEVGRGTIVADPRHPGRVYLGHGGVIRIQADIDEEMN